MKKKRCKQVEPPKQKKVKLSTVWFKYLKTFLKGAWYSKYKSDSKSKDEADWKQSAANK